MLAPLIYHRDRALSTVAVKRRILDVPSCRVSIRSSPVQFHRQMGSLTLGGGPMDHDRTAVVSRITDYSMSGVRRGPDGRFVRVDGLRDQLARPRRTEESPPDPRENIAFVAPARLRIG
jgi:hypothetical protein